MARESSSTESTSSILAPLTPSNPMMAVKNAYLMSIPAIKKRKLRENPPGRIPARSSWATRTARSPSRAPVMPPAGRRAYQRSLGRPSALDSVGCRAKQVGWLTVRSLSRHSRCGWMASCGRGRSDEGGETSPRRRFQGPSLHWEHWISDLGPCYTRMRESHGSSERRAAEWRIRSLSKSWGKKW